MIAILFYHFKKDHFIVMYWWIMLIYFMFFSLLIKIIIPENIFSFAVGSYLALSRATFRSNKRSCSSLVRKSSSSSTSSSRNSSSSFDNIWFYGQKCTIVYHLISLQWILLPPRESRREFWKSRGAEHCAVQINISEVNKVPYQFIKSSGEGYQKEKVIWRLWGRI